MNSEFNVGDTVMLVSGGPHMTIVKILDDGNIEVAWIDDVARCIRKADGDPKFFVLIEKWHH